MKLPDELVDQFVEEFLENFSEILEPIKMIDNELILKQLVMDNKLIFILKNDIIISWILPTVGSQKIQITNSLGFFSSEQLQEVNNFLENLMSVKENHIIHCRFIHTKKEYRGQGKCGDMFRYIEQTFPLHSSITLNTLQSNLSALKSYKKHGFEITGEFTTDHKFFHMTKNY